MYIDMKTGFVNRGINFILGRGIPPISGLIVTHILITLYLPRNSVPLDTFLVALETLGERLILRVALPE
jgi:hypothetical protein